MQQFLDYGKCPSSAWKRIAVISFLALLAVAGATLGPKAARTLSEWRQSWRLQREIAACMAFEDIPDRLVCFVGPTPPPGAPGLEHPENPSELRALARWGSIEYYDDIRPVWFMHARRSPARGGDELVIVNLYLRHISDEGLLYLGIRVITPSAALLGSPTVQERWDTLVHLPPAREYRFFAGNVGEDTATLLLPFEVDGRKWVIKGHLRADGRIDCDAPLPAR